MSTDVTTPGPADAATPSEDHDHTRPDGPAVVLPGNPDLKQVKTRAKELRRGVQRGVPEAVATFAEHHPAGAALVADEPGRARVTLRDAQVALARSYGFEGWNALVTTVGRARVEERDMHRWFGVELNNEVWDLLQSGVDAGSPQPDRDLVLYGAFASARHWMESPGATVANTARAEHLVARAAVAVGEHALALTHARRCLDLVEANPDAMEVWDAPFAHEALARALAATGDTAGAAEHRRLAVELTAACPDPGDREVLEAELARAPWFGLAQARDKDLAEH